MDTVIAQLDAVELCACERLANPGIQWPMQQKDVLRLLDGVVNEGFGGSALRAVVLVDALVGKGILERYSEFWITPRVDLARLRAGHPQADPKRNSADPRGGSQSILPSGYEVVMAALLHVEGSSTGRVPGAIANWLRMQSVSDIPDARTIDSILALLREKQWITFGGFLTKKGRAIATIWEERIKKSPEGW